VVTGGTPCPTTTAKPYGGEVDPYGGVPGYGYGKGFPPFWPPFWWWKWPGGFPYGQEGTDTKQPYGPVPPYGPKPGPWVRGELCFTCFELKNQFW